MAANYSFLLLVFAGICAVLTNSLPAGKDKNDKSGEYVPIEVINSMDSQFKEHLMVALDSKTGAETYQTEEEVKKVVEMSKKYPYRSLVNRANSTDNQNETEDSTDRNKRYIFGSDDRVRITNTSSFPYCGIGQLSVSGEIGNCTVFLVGRRHAVTAGHCVFNTTTRTYHSLRLRVYFGRTCDRYGDSASVQVIRTYAAYRVFGSIQYDIAFLELDSSEVNSFTSSNCIMDFGYLNTSRSFSARVCGFSRDQTTTGDSYTCMTCANGQAALACYTNSAGSRVCVDNVFIHNCDTTQDQDGGPLLTTTHPGHPEYIAYGVNSKIAVINQRYLYNRATRFSREIFIDVCVWMNQTGGACVITFI